MNTVVIIDHNNNTVHICRTKKDVTDEDVITDIKERVGAPNSAEYIAGSAVQIIAHYGIRAAAQE